jgi:heptaprenyl diphosphate synthase
VLGKEQGTDLRERIFSLPVVLAAKVDPDVYALVRGDLSSERSLAAALEALRASTAMEEARAMTVRWAEEARAVLGPLPEGPPKAALSALCDLVVSRTS